MEPTQRRSTARSHTERNSNLSQTNYNQKHAQQINGREAETATLL